MRAEWAVGRARVRRWEEEVELLLEEMDRAVLYFEWKATWWYDRIDARPDARADIKSGLAAYARQKAVMFDMLAAGCRSHWRKALASCMLEDKWPESAASDEALRLAAASSELSAFTVVGGRDESSRLEAHSDDID